MKRVAVLAALVVPSNTAPKLIPPPANAVGVAPVPDSVTVCVPPVVAVLSIVSVPAGCAPRTVGLSVRPTLQLAPAPNEPELGHGEGEAVASA